MAQPRNKFQTFVQNSIQKVRSARQQVTHEGKDVNYTVPGLIALVAIVLVTAMYFSQPNIAERASTGNLAGSAYASPVAESVKECDASSYCDGTKLVRQHTDCTEYVAFCQYGCSVTPSGATCR
jgi:hypothetical protein